MAEKTFTRDQYLKELPEIVKNMDGFRQGSNKSLPVDIHLGDMLPGEIWHYPGGLFQSRRVQSQSRHDGEYILHAESRTSLARSGDCP